MNRKLSIGVSASIFGPDPARSIYNGRPLLYVEQSMTDWLMEHGVVPYLIPVPTGKRASTASYEELIAPLDGLLLQGGVDVSPLSYGAQPIRPEWSGDSERDRYEIGLIRAAMAVNKPVLGICRGLQVINVALGGTLYQDIATQIPSALQHRNIELYERNHHGVDIAPGSALARWFGTQFGTVNSVHHQAIHELAPGLVVEARASEDDLIEAVRTPFESTEDPWVVGVQWHPEFQDPDDTSLLPTKPLLDAFINAIRER